MLVQVFLFAWTLAHLCVYGFSFQSLLVRHNNQIKTVRGGSTFKSIQRGKIVLSGFNLDGVEEQPEKNNDKSNKNQSDNGISDEDEIFYSQLRQRMAELQMEEDTQLSGLNLEEEEEDSSLAMPPPIMGISRPPVDQYSQSQSSNPNAKSMGLFEDQEQQQAFSIVGSILSFSAFSALGFVILSFVAGDSFVHFRSTPSAVLNSDIQTIKTRNFVDADRILSEDFARYDSVLFDNLRPQEDSLPPSQNVEEVNNDDKTFVI